MPLCSEFIMERFVSQLNTMVPRPVRVYRTDVCVTVPRYRCPCCNQVMQARIRFKEPSHRITQQLYDYVSWLLTRDLTLTKGANITGLSINTVREIDKERLTRLYTINGELRRPERQAETLAIDEFKLHDGHQFATSVTNMLIAKTKGNPLIKRLMTIPGVGPISASAIVAKVSDASEFESGRELAAFFGMAPCQNSTGGRNTLGSISKTGDPYIRKLLSQGAQVVVSYAKHHQEKHLDDQLDRFAARLIEHGKPRTKVVIAVAAKMIRTAWAMLRHGTDYTPVMHEAQEA